MLILGSCAAESEEQVMWSARMAKERGAAVFRASLDKPRTKVGWDGVGVDTGGPWLAKASKQFGIVAATEVMAIDDAKKFVEIMSEASVGQFIIWLGSRNQNHKYQEAMGRLVRENPMLILGIKNQPWRNLDHWLGIVEHVRAGGASDEQLFLVHRGFQEKDSEYRNKPDWKMMLEVKAKTGLPMIVDPSHIAGEARLVIATVNLALKYPIDGFMIEVHANPKMALTDQRQQLSWEDYDLLLRQKIASWKAND